MKRKPLLLIAVAWAYLAIAVSFPIQVIALYEHGPGEWRDVLSKLTLLNWLVIAGLTATAGLLLRASALARRMVPLMIGLVLLNNYIVGRFAGDFSLETTWLATIGFCALNSPLLLPRIRFLLRHPELRWWRAAPRANVRIPIVIGQGAGDLLKLKSLNVSETGAFVALEEPLKDWSMDLLKSHQPMRIKMDVGLGRPIECEGRVVRVTDGTESQPRGMGIAFTHLSFRGRRELRRFVSAEI